MQKSKQASAMVLQSNLESETYAPSLARLLHEEKGRIVKIGVHAFYHRLFNLHIQKEDTVGARVRAHEVGIYEKSIMRLFSEQGAFDNSFFFMQPFKVEYRNTLAAFEDNMIAFEQKNPVFYTMSGEIYSEKNRDENRRSGAKNALFEKLSASGVQGIFLFGMSTDSCVRRARADLEMMSWEVGKPLFVAINRLVTKNLGEF